MICLLFKREFSEFCVECVKYRMHKKGDQIFDEIVKGKNFSEKTTAVIVTYPGWYKENITNTFCVEEGDTVDLYLQGICQNILKGKNELEQGGENDN